MRASSQASLATVTEAFEPVLDAAGAGAGAIGEQLFAVVDLLDASAALRRGLTDPGRSADDRAALAEGLLRGTADDRVADVLSGLARQRWSGEHDLAEAAERLAATAVLAGAEAEGGLARVEDELFRFDRLLVGQRELRAALADRRATPAARAALVVRLVDDHVTRPTRVLLERVAAAPRGRSLAASLSLLGELAAQRRERLVATVTTAAPLTTAQRDRLLGLLERAYGRAVRLHEAVEPTVMGGVRVQVGADVVDATVLARLADARRRIAG